MTDMTTAGITLAAAEALICGQETFTRTQVAYLLALALDQRRVDDLAETIATWREKHENPPSRADRVTARVAEMTATAQAEHLRRGRPEGYEYTGGPVDWDTSLPLWPASEAPFPLPLPLFPARDGGAA